jgi:stage III sporulation protein SpoIIIAA
MNPEAELKLLFDVLPEPLRSAAEAVPGSELLEIVLDLGRPPEARLAGRTLPLGDGLVTQEHLDHVLERVGEVTDDNRAGIERTLHRVSAIRNRRGRVIGITLRVGRAIVGTIDMLRDLVQSGKNILLLGRPGIGKTTKLREVARVLADDLQKRVMVIDTSNEIGGDGDIPHPAIGHARRLQVSRPDRQHAVMIEAVENHMPEVIIVDEIGTEPEAQAARTIAERGVQLVATAHGNTLENLVLNPTLSDLVGGVHTVTLGDEEARRRGTLKTVNERRAPPTFDVVVEMVTRDEVIVHRDTAGAVDALLAGKAIPGERRRQKDGEVEIAQVPRAVASLPSAVVPGEVRQGPIRIHVYGFGRDVTERALRSVSDEVRLVSRPEAADLLFVLRSRAGDPRIRRVVEKGTARVHLVKRASAAELRRGLRGAFLASAGTDEEIREATAEAEHAIDRAMSEGVAVALSPRPPRIRRLQHELAERYHLESESSGSGGQRHLVIHPPGEAERARRERTDLT